MPAPATLASLLVALGLADQGLEINPFAAVIAALGLIYGAYLTDVLRGGIQAVPKGQIEAAKAFGMHGPRRFVRDHLPADDPLCHSGPRQPVAQHHQGQRAVSAWWRQVSEIMSVGRGAANSTKHFIFFFGATADRLHDHFRRLDVHHQPAREARQSRRAARVDGSGLMQFDPVYMFTVVMPQLLMAACRSPWFLTIVSSADRQCTGRAGGLGAALSESAAVDCRRGPSSSRCAARRC